MPTPRPNATRRYARQVSTSGDPAAVLALIEGGRRTGGYAEAIERAVTVRELVAAEHGLLADELLDRAQLQIERWRGEGIGVLTMMDDDYPANLKALPNRPPLLFVAGRLQPTDRQSAAIIGSRRATSEGTATARGLARALVEHGYTVNSGLAEGIDRAAHVESMARGGRTVAVIGTGLRHCYPSQNAELQRQVAAEGAVISQFWPHTPPRRENFPMRNAVMSGISLASIVVEASARSGARIQARLSLAQGRPVILVEPLLSQHWARELSERPGAYVIGSPSEAPALLDRLSAASAAG